MRRVRVGRLPPQVWDRVNPRCSRQSGGGVGGSFAPGKPAPDARLHLDRMQEATVYVSPSTAQPLARFNGPDVQNISTSAPQLNTSLSVAQVVSQRLARPEQPAVTMGAAWPQSVPGRARQARSMSAYAPRLPHRRHSLRAACRCSQAQHLLRESGEAPLEPSKAGPICTCSDPE